MSPKASLLGISLKLGVALLVSLYLVEALPPPPGKEVLLPGEVPDPPTDEEMVMDPMKMGSNVGQQGMKMGEFGAGLGNEGMQLGMMHGSELAKQGKKPPMPVPKVPAGAVPKPPAAAGPAAADEE